MTWRLILGYGSTVVQIRSGLRSRVEPHADLGLCRLHRGSNDHVPAFVRLCDSLARPSASYSFCCDCASHVGMDSPPTVGSFPLGQRASLSAARSRWRLWREVPRSDRVAGQSRSAHRSEVTL